MGMTPEQTAALTKKRWVILIASCLINLCVGSMYAWSSLSAPMATELGVEASAMASVFSTANAVGFITMIIGGLLNDKYGPRWVMFVGGLMFGLGMFTCGFAKSVGNLDSELWCDPRPGPEPGLRLHHQQHHQVLP